MTAFKIPDDETDARYRKGGSKSCIEKRNKPIRYYTRSAQRNTPTHHDGHDDIAALVKELENVCFVFLVSFDALGMFADHFGEYENVKDGEYNERPNDENPEQPACLHKIGCHPDVGDVDTGNKPDDACNKQELFGRYLQH